MPERTLPAVVVESIHGQPKREAHVDTNRDLWDFMKDSEQRDVALRSRSAYAALEAGGSWSYGAATYEIRED